MTITLNSNYQAKPDTRILGYKGEHNARTIAFEGLTVSGADHYKLRIEYNDKLSYEADIINGEYTVDGSLLRSVQTVGAQILAVKTNSGGYDLVKKSNVFELKILPSLNGEPAPIPSYQAAKEYFDQILEYIDTEGNGLHFRNRSEFPSTGLSQDLYIAKDEGKIYRYDTAQGVYVSIGGSVDITDVNSAIASALAGYYTSAQVDSRLGGLSFVKLTQAEYDLIPSPAANTVYIIVG